MKKRVILGILFVNIMFLFGTVGCGNNNTDNKNDVNKVIEETTVNGTDAFSGEKETAELDFDKAANNIVFNGKDIKLPTTLNELGGDFTVEYKKITEFDDITLESYDVLVNYEVIGRIVQLYEEEKNYKDRIIVGISASGTDMTIDGVSIGDDVGKMFEKWGEPQIVTEMVTIGNTYTYKNKSDMVYINTTKDGKIASFTFKYESAIK